MPSCHAHKTWRIRKNRKKWEIQNGNNNEESENVNNNEIKILIKNAHTCGIDVETSSSKEGGNRKKN